MFLKFLLCFPEQQLNVRMSPSASPVTVAGNSPRKLDSSGGPGAQEISQPKVRITN